MPKLSLQNLIRRARHARKRNSEEARRLDPLPIRGPLRRYNSTKFGQDFRAAINVALLALPQGMAYAAIAELPIAYGIACSAVAAIVAPFFSGSRHTILGPTNATAFMIFSFFLIPKGIPSFPKWQLLGRCCLLLWYRKRGEGVILYTSGFL